MPIPTTKEIVDLIKLGATLPAQEKIMELRVFALELQEENIGLKARIKEVEAELAQKQALKHKRGVYWIEGDMTPFCPRCYETAAKLIHLFGPKSFAEGDLTWECHVCAHAFSGHATGDSPFHPSRPGYLRT